MPTTRTLLALSLLALGGCPTARMHVPAVELTISASRTAAAPGDTLELAGVLHNRGAAPVTLEFRDACDVRFYVQAAAGPIALPEDGLWPCTGEAARRTLAPGERAETTVRWVAGVPGEYRAYAVLGEHYVWRAGERALKLGHRSNEVEIVVRSASR